MEARLQENGDCKGHEKTGNVLLGLSRTVVAETQRMLGSIWKQSADEEVVQC